MSPSNMEIGGIEMPLYRISSTTGPSSRVGSGSYKELCYVILPGDYEHIQTQPYGKPFSPVFHS